MLSAVSPITETPLDLAERCDTGECQLPYCYCSKDGTNIPKDLSAEDVSRTLKAKKKEAETLLKCDPQKFKNLSGFRAKTFHCSPFPFGIHSASCCTSSDTQQKASDKELLISPTVISRFVLLSHPRDMTFNF